MARQKGPLNAAPPSTVGHMPSQRPGAQTTDAESAQCTGRGSAGSPQHTASPNTPDGVWTPFGHANGVAVTRLTDG